MSSNYLTEPPTKGKVIIHTTEGPLEVEVSRFRLTPQLWPKEAPKAARNFVQLCLEGYYDKTVFHRVVENFIIQVYISIRQHNLHSSGRRSHGFLICLVFLILQELEKAVTPFMENLLQMSFIPD